MDNLIVFWLRAYLIAFVILLLVFAISEKPVNVDAAFRKAGTYSAIIATLATGLRTVLNFN